MSQKTRTREWFSFTKKAHIKLVILWVDDITCLLITKVTHFQQYYIHEDNGSR